ncbi:winged helix-turn-helix domain-containing protein [Paracoccus sp. XHP0099]|uniref:Winged helix-turn-helix domain-containing protein n=2 Tax=Paracoccus marinaquae TaxID=2841926 RepID=A0ABS6AH16_9RHOB|nr:winged helix-turn-helix domain-containing protein [Paracoccus marinaquae]
MKVDTLTTDASGAEELSIGRVRFLRDTRQLLDQAGNPVLLGDQAGRVLAVLAERPNMVVSKDDLLSGAWGDIHVTENNLSQCVRQIRSAIGDRDGSTLLTVPKRGYRLVPNDRQATAPEPRRAGRSWRMRLAAMAALVVAAIFLAVGLKDRDMAGIPPATAASAPSLVVLPFQDMTGDARWQRLGNGLAVGLSGEFARHRELRVGAAASLEEAGKPSFSPAEAADRYGMRMILDGTILAQDDRIRLTARLTDSERGQVVWTRSWDGSVGDIFAWQDEIYERIVSIIAAEWTGVLSQETLSRGRAQPTDSIDAYELYLLGSAEKHLFTPESMKRAEDYLKRALAMDPQFAKAWASLDITYLYLGDYAQTEEEKQRYYEASSQAKIRAYEADPNDPYVLIRYSSYLASQQQQDRATDLLRRAVEAAPSDADILAHATFGAAWRGVTGPEPVGWIEKALSLTPDPPGWYIGALGFALFHDQRFEEALGAFDRAPDMSDVLVFKAATEALTGDIDAARETVAEVRRLAPSLTAADLGPNKGQTIGPSWEAYFEGTRLAGLPGSSEN